MTKQFARPLLHAALVVALAGGVSGCQTMSDLDPTGLLSDDSAPAPDSQFPTDSQQQAQADASTTTPDLGSIPTRPAQPDATAQANTAQAVTAAGSQAQYSADALRAGTEAAAPPPGAAPAAPAPGVAPPTATASAAPSANDAPPTTFAGDAPPTAGSEATVASAAPNPNAAVPSGAEPPAPPPTAPAPVAAAPAPEAAPAATPAPVATAAMAPPPGAEPAVPAVPATAGSRMAMVNPSDAQLGFKPSSAPPLNSAINQWVPSPLLAHYRQTAAQAGSAGTAEPAVAAVPAVSGGKRVASAAGAGDVVANLNAAPGTPQGMAAAMNGGVPPTAIIYFPGDGTALSAAARGQIRQAVAAYQASGGAASIKVVGHSSSRTGNMSVEKHLEVIFQKSQARANAVGQALIKAGVPADKVQIEAVGDSQPIYYESMPKGEDGNRRAEIFVQ